MTPRRNPTESEIRKHYYLEQYVVIAASRSRRPDNFKATALPHTSNVSHCSFCNLNEPLIAGYPSPAKWSVGVVANAYPALSLDNLAAYGAMEVIIETPNHEHEFSGLPISQIKLIVSAYCDRLTALYRLPGIKYVLAFKNDGPLAGASLNHAHSQIMALPLVPPNVQAESEALSHYHDKHGRCAICDLNLWEQREEKRIIFTGEHITTISPYAPSHPYEVWFIPNRHIRQLSELTARERHSLAKSLKLVTSKLDNAVISFNFYVQEALPGTNHHLIIKLEPRLPMFFGGAEMATGVIINPVNPEFAAGWYNQEI